MPMLRRFQYDAATAQYVYDALNRRVRVQTGAGTVEYSFDPFGRRVSTWNGGAGIQGQIYWSYGQLAYRDTTTYFDHRDLFGTERVRTDPTGAVVSSYSSLPWGDGYVPNETDPGGTAQVNEHYALLEHDAESGTDHAQFRQYSNIQGRWMSPDPYDGSYRPWNPQSFNRYTYGMNRPLSSTDPTGMDDSIGGCDSPESRSGGVHAHDCEGGDPNGGGGGGSTDGGSTDGGSPVSITNITVTTTPEPPVDLDDPLDCLSCGLEPTPLMSYGGGAGAPSNGPAPSPCQATLLNMANQQLGTNFNSSNVAGSYMNETAYNIIIQSNQLTAGQFNNIQLGRYTTSDLQYFTGAGLAGHIADETNLGFAQSAFQSSNIGGNLSVSFAFHDDHGYANNPIGALIHFFTDVLGHNTRKPC
jgi:RHS repeat-associated protein